MRCVILLWSKYDLNEIKLLLILLVDPLKASEIQRVTQSLGASPAEQTLCIFVWSTRQSWWCCMHYLKSLQLPESKHFNLQPLTTPSAGLKLLTSRVEEKTEIFLSKRNSVSLLTCSSRPERCFSPCDQKIITCGLIISLSHVIKNFSGSVVLSLFVSINSLKRTKPTSFVCVVQNLLHVLTFKTKCLLYFTVHNYYVCWKDRCNLVIILRRNKMVIMFCSVPSPVIL